MISFSEDILQVHRWIRILDIILGIVGIILGIFVIVIMSIPGIFFLFVPHITNITELILLWLVGIGLILFGLIVIIKGFIIKRISLLSKILYTVSGLLLIIFGGLAYTYPILTEFMIFLLMFIGIIIYGIIFVLRSLLDSEKTLGRRLLLFIIDFLLIAIAIPGAIYWSIWTQPLLLILLGIALTINGLFRIIIGVISEIY